MNAVKVGQVWKDKDKRRNTVIEITKLVDSYVQALVVGTEDERSYYIDRLLKRWELIKDVTTEATLNEAAEAVRDGKAKLILKDENEREVIVPERTRAKQPVYQLKLISPEVPDYKVRTTQKMLDEYGYPRDPWGNQMELA